MTDGIGRINFEDIVVQAHKTVGQKPVEALLETKETITEAFKEEVKQEKQVIKAAVYI